MRNLDLEKAKKTIVAGIKEYIGDNNVIIGISGGIDSALVAALCVKALGRDKVLGIMLPYGDQSDIEDSISLVEALGFSCKKINIKTHVDAFDLGGDDWIKGNIMARVRMAVLYSYANLINGRVIGTTNKSEMAIGYFTKYGDGACDLEPIADLYKTEVWRMSELFNIPKRIICKKPSAGLCAGQTDEGDFGFTYIELDAYLQGEEIDPFKAAKIQKMIDNSEHKRKMPPIINVSKP